MVTILFADGPVLLAEESVKRMHRRVFFFLVACKRRKLKVNASKSKVLVCKRVNEVIDFVMSCRLKKKSELKCRVRMGGELLENVREQIFLGGFNTLYTWHSRRNKGERAV